MDFKVGDRVESKQPSYGYTGNIVKITKDYALVERDGKSIKWHCSIVKDRIATAAGVWDQKSFLKIIKKETTMDFKIGDKVKIKQNCSGCRSGEIGVLKDKHGDGDLFAMTKNCEGTDGCSCESNWELAKRGQSVEEKPMQFIVIFDEPDGDPHKLFATKKEMEKWVRTALSDSEVINDSMIAYELGRELKIGHKITFRKVKK